DRERELAVRHGDLAGVRAVRRGLDGEDRSRRERGGDELLRLVAVIDDVHLLAAELVDDVRDARAAGADAGADRVAVRVVADDRDLRSGAGLAGDGLDLDRAVEDLGDLLLEQAADEVRVRAGDDGLRALLRLLHVHDVDLHIVALADVFGADLLALRQDRLGLADLERKRARLRVDALHKRADQLLVAASELLHHLAALAVADALADDVARRLRGDAAEL